MLLLVIVGWWYCILNAKIFSKVMELFWNKVYTSTGKYLTGHPVFWKYNLACCYKVICTKALLLNDWEFSVVIYNTKIMLDINCKMSALPDSHGLPAISCDITLSLGVWPDNQNMWGSFWLLLLYQHSCWFKLLTHIIAFLFFFTMSVWLICSLFITSSCSGIGTIIILPLMAILCLIAI